MSRSPRPPLTRRDFLKLTGVGLSAAALKACAGIPPTPQALPTSTSPPPTGTPSPTGTPTAAPIEAAFPEMILVEAGEFRMGSTDGYENERPVHSVRLTRPFYIARYETTFEAYDRYCDDKKKGWVDDRGWGRGDLAIFHVDWYDAVDYCNWLSEKAGLSPCYSGKGKFLECDFAADGYRLPTEAEWEFTARGGTRSQGFTYAGGDDPNEVAWYGDNSDDRLHPVGEKAPNELGLYDMCGNIVEWCWDWYGADYYRSSPGIDPLGPPPPQTPQPWEYLRVRRGGNWQEDPINIRCCVRSFDSMDYPGGNGFRLVRTAQA